MPDKLRYAERDIAHAVKAWAMTKLRAYHAASGSNLNFEGFLERLELDTLKADFRVKLTPDMPILVLLIECRTKYGVPFVLEIPYESVGTFAILREIVAAAGGVIHI